MLVDIFLEPAVQRFEFALFHFIRNFRVCFKGTVKKVCSKNITQRVSLEGAADEARKPVDILQHTILIVRRGNAKICFEAFVPGLWQVADGKTAFEQL